MKKEIENEELKTIIENHQHWIYKDCLGWENMRADLSETMINRADLRGCNLKGAIFIGAAIIESDFSRTNLFEADLRRANLLKLNLRGANLDYANLRDTCLRGVNLSGATFHKADLYEADITGANLYRANFNGAKNVPFIPYACPDFGAFIGYKKAKCKIVELEIPADAKRLSATDRKCRCDRAKVLGIYNYNHKLLDIDYVHSDFDENFVYKVGEIVEVENFDDNRWNECSDGIHFFINFQEAVEY